MAAGPNTLIILPRGRKVSKCFEYAELRASTEIFRLLVFNKFQLNQLMEWINGASVND